MDGGAMMEGTLRNAIPFREGIEGMQIKLIFVDVPSELMKTIIVPAFEKIGAVQLVNSREEEEQRTRAKKKAQDSAQKAAAIGDVQEMSKIVHKLIEMKEQDDDNKQDGPRGSKRFADGCISLLDRCTRVGAANLRENMEPGTADS